MADSLVARNADGPTISELGALRLLITGRCRSGIGIQHAKSLLGRLPDKSSLWINQFIFGVMTKMVMVMTARELEKSVIDGDVSVRIAHDDVGIADVWRFHGKADNRA